jgi:Bacterial SH3 domain
MNKKIFTSLLVILALSACAQSPSTPTATPSGPFIPGTPTLYLGSPVPALNTPGAGETAAPFPLPTFTPLTQPTPGGPPNPSNLYAVIRVAPDDTLNIRSEPGVESSVVGTLQPTQSGLTRTGKTSSVGEETWVEIQNPGGGTGWVNTDFLTAYVDPAAFCADARVTSLMDDLKTAVNTTNSKLFSSLVSPVHGLDVVYIRDGTVANYTPDEAGWAFQSTYQVDWGTGAGSGQTVSGTFPEIILPALQDVFKNVSLTCNEIKLGGATYTVEWPSEYANLNFYSLYNPGNDPSNAGLDWRTWLAGVEYVDGQPYLFSLSNYQWEP